VRRVVLVVAFVAAALAAAPAALADETVELVPGALGFRPNSVTVAAGERVVFRNRDRVARRVVGDNDAFTTPLLRPGESAVVRFGAVGTVGFHDARDAARRGAVVVVVPPHVVTMRASATTVGAGTAVVFSGRISPARAGEVVQLLRFESDGSVNILDSVVTRRDGRWSITSPVTATGTYRARWGREITRALRVRVR